VGRAAVLGHPIGHSLSPVLHTAGYAALGLSGWSYDAVDCTEDAFAAWFAGLDLSFGAVATSVSAASHVPDTDAPWRGLSLTMPLKRVVIPLLDRISPLAEAVGAVNTVTWDDARRPVGDNTDVHGIVEALRSAGVEKAGSACVLGAGATACSAMAALAQLGCEQVQLQARSAARAAEALAVADRVGVQASVTSLDDFRGSLQADVVINTLPAEPAAEWARALASVAGPPPSGVLLDVTYHPWPTPPAATWRSSGGTAVGGFEMLLHQAAAQFTLMTAHPAPLAAMRTAGERALVTSKSG
jgi:shikimate dehydrogenase